VYGDAGPEIQAVCERRTLRLHIFPWQPQMGRAGLRRDAVYLVRPDGYVGLVDPEGRAAAVTSYLDARQLTTRRRPPRRSEPARPVSTA
jgi:hypothetical protein